MIPYQGLMYYIKYIYNDIYFILSYSSSLSLYAR